MAYLGVEPGSRSVRNSTVHTAAAGQNTYSVTGGYMKGYVDVFVNGTKTLNFTATDNQSVVLNANSTLNDKVEIIAYSPLAIYSVVNKSGDAMGGDLTLPNLIATANVGGANGYFNNLRVNQNTFINNSLTVIGNTTHTGSLTLTGNLNLTGSLIITGEATSVTTQSLAVEDSIITMAANNTTGDTLDIGFAGKYNNGSANVWTGLIRNATDKEYYFFQEYDTTPGNDIDILDASFQIANVHANFTGNVQSNNITVVQLNATNLNMTSSITLTGDASGYKQNSTTVYGGDAGAGFGRIEYYANKWVFNAGSDSANIAFFQRGNLVKSFIDDNGDFSGTANNANNLGGTAAASYLQTSGSYTISGTRIHTANLEVRTANLIINTSAGIVANGTMGTNGQVLTSNGTTLYWSSSGAGVNTDAQYIWTNNHTFRSTITFGNSTVNSTINSTILAISSVTANLTGNVAATTITGNLTGNVAATTITGNLTGNVAATTITGNLTGNVIATTISGNLTGNVAATTITGNLTGNVVATTVNSSSINATSSLIVGANVTMNTTTLTMGNSTHIGAPQVIVSNTSGTTTINTNYVSTTTITGNLTGNVAAVTISGNLTGNVVATTITGNLTGNVLATTVNAATFQVGTAFTANATVVNAVSYNIGTFVVANSTVVNATHLGGTAAASYQLNSTLNANIAAYLPTYTGTVNASLFQVGTAFTANATVVNAVSYNAGTRVVANTTVVNATHLEGVAAASYVNTSGNYTVSGNLNFTGSNSTVNAVFRVVNSTANVFFAAANGNVGIGNTSPAHKLRVEGTTSLAGAVSDITTLAAGNTTITGFVNSTTTGQFGGNLTLASTSAIIANSVAGTSGQVLTSNGSAVYWSTVSSGSGTVTSITMGNGLSSTQSPLTTSGTMSVVAGTGGGLVSNASGVFVTAGTGTVVNATGVHVNASYIATISANNTTYVNGKTEGNLNVNNATTAYGKTEGNLNVNNAIYMNGNNVLSVMESLRANRNLSGGGTITVSASGDVLWSSRFIVISNGRGTHFSTSGYFDITCPVTGTITGVGGATNKTATAAGIPLGAWEALYYILPIGSAATSLAANFRVVNYTADVEIPSDWVLVCVKNNDNGNFTFNNGVTLEAGQSYDTTLWNSSISPASNNATNLGGFAAANYARTDTADSFDGVVTFNANAVLTKLLSANASFGTAGQFLRSGATTNTYWGSLLSADVTTALGYTPYNSTNPSGYVTSSGVTSITGGTGLSGGTITTTGTLSVNASYIATIAVPLTGGTMSGALTVSGTGAAILQTSGDIYAYRSGGTTGVIFLNSGGTRYLYYDGTNYQMPGTALYVGGDIIAFSSDIRIKKDIRQIEHPLEKIKQIRGVRYNHNEFGLEQGMPKEPQVGVIAQEVEKVLPEVVTLAPFDYDGVDDHGNKRSKSGENYKTVKYEKIVPLLIEAIKELSAQVDDLKKRLGD